MKILRPKILYINEWILQMMDSGKVILLIKGHDQWVFVRMKRAMLDSYKTWWLIVLRIQNKT